MRQAYVAGSYSSPTEEGTRFRNIIRGLNPKTDALVALPGWQSSRGAREEVALAQGVPVLTVRETMR